MKIHDPEELIAKNPKVDPRQLNEVLKLLTELQGTVPEPGYRLAPPFSRTPPSVKRDDDKAYPISASR